MYKLKKNTNVVLFGTGKAGSYHAKVLSAIENVSILGVVNSGRSDPVKFRKEYQIPNWIKNLNDLEKLGKIDAFIIATSSESTLSVVRRVASFGIPCLIEKPLGTSIEQSTEIISCLDRGHLNFVGYNRRFYSCILQAQTYIKKLGSPISVHVDAPEPLCSLIKRGKAKEEINKRLILNTTHAIDLLTLFLGEYRKVTNFDHNSYRNGIKMDFMSFIKFHDRKTASFISHWASPGDWCLKIFGEDYQIIINLTQNSGYLKTTKLGVKKFEKDKDDTKFKAGILKQTYYFLSSVAERKLMHENLCDLNSGCLSIRFANELM